MSCEREHLERPRLRPLEVLQAEVNARPVYVLKDPLGFSPEPTVISAEAGFILGLLDGSRDRSTIQAEFARRFGEILFNDLLDGILHELDRRHLLEGATFERERERMVAEFAASAVRAPAHAGDDRAYPDDPERLDRFLAGMLGSSAREPAAPGAGASRPLRALIAPHIDHARGRNGYAQAYGALLGAGAVASRWLVLGVSHAILPGQFALTRKDFGTPLGAVPTDRDFVDRLASRLPFDPFAGEWNHKQEHSIELQAVILRWLFPGQDDLRLVPILCGFPAGGPDLTGSPRGDETVERFLGATGEALAAAAGPTMLLGAVDLAHVGRQFGDPAAAGPADLAALESDDRAMLAPVLAGDAEGFHAALRGDGNRRRVCGLPALYALLRLLPPGAPGELLGYHQWDDGASAVSFAAAAFRG